jgi:uncharacterized protein (DUF1015 family)
MMKDKTCIIADGHHRYETGLAYLKQTSNPKARFQMTAFANVFQRGLVILATHRLVGSLRDFSVEKFLAGLKKSFEVTRLDLDSSVSKLKAAEKMFMKMKTLGDEGKNTFSIYCGGTFYTAVLKDKNVIDSVAPQRSSAWKLLDVSILHKLVLEKLLGICEEEAAKGNHIEYVRDSSMAIVDSLSKVDRGRKQLVFFVNPVKLQQLKAVTEAGEKMPQKSTYFYPKVYSGLTINKL